MHCFATFEWFLLSNVEQPNPPHPTPPHHHHQSPIVLEVALVHVSVVVYIPSQPDKGPFHTRKLRRRNSRNFGTFQVWKR